VSDRGKLSLLRVAMILITIIGSVYVFSVLSSLRDGNVEPVRLIVAVVVVIALVWMNRWWFRQSGTRI
jgi:hypothetical protein